MKGNIRNNKYKNRIILFNKYKHKNPLFYNFIIILFIINIKVCDSYQEINITIKGTGEQKILNEESINQPNHILINGILQNYTGYYVYNLIENINIISIRWDNKLTSCNYMFHSLNNIIEFDFSNFDTSEVTDMDGMFENLNSLKILDLSNFNTSSVKNIDCMFNGCSSLLSLNLNIFDTLNVEYFFSGMFGECNSLIYLNLYSFIITDNVNVDDVHQSMDFLFWDVSGYICYNDNTYLSLSGYQNSCDNICFNNQSKLIIDNKTCINECYNDNIFKYEYKNICFQSCSEISQILYGTSDIKIYYDYNNTKCIDKIPDGYYCNDTDINSIDKCNIKCKTCNNESIVNDLCLSCNIENNYYPIINNISINNLNINCSNSTPSGYFFDNNSLSYNICYSSCKECFSIGDNYNHQCKECIDDYYLNNTNCYKNCSYYYYFNNSHGYCTEDEKCPENKRKLIKEKGECIEDCSKDDIYKYEYNNTCFSSCLEIDLLGNTDLKIYYNYNKTKCIDKIPDGYYLNDSISNTIDKCNIKCKTCNNESTLNDLCITCNNENNYYPLINNFSDNNSYINCSNSKPSGYAFDNYSLSYNICYSSCKECFSIGDNYNHQCSECIENYYLNNTNCYKNCSYYY